MCVGIEVKRLFTDERVRFLLVGGFNTFFGFAVFSALQFSVGSVITIFGSLYISHAISSTVAFFLYRHFVFTVSGHFWRDFARFQSVYAVPLLTNTLLLPVIIVVFHVNPYVAQATTIVVLTIVSYFGHKFFSFKRPDDVAFDEAAEPKMTSDGESEA